MPAASHFQLCLHLLDFGFVHFVNIFMLFLADFQLLGVAVPVTLKNVPVTDVYPKVSNYMKNLIRQEKNFNVVSNF